MSTMGPPSTPKSGEGPGTKPPTPAPGSTTFSHPSVSPSNIMGNVNTNSAPPPNDNTVSPHGFSRQSPSTNTFNSNAGSGSNQTPGMGLSTGGMVGNRGGPSSFLGGGTLGPSDLFGNLGGLGGNLGGMLPLDDYVVDMSNETFTDSDFDKYITDFLGDPKTGDSKDDDVAAAMT
ncbi:hypothetical protein BS47DRAFT_1042664 [Hydnum rufescens UP504]|uniref:Uncharacterized protein n=1 Tax=Hydnum rufescens UP504 TaxID=1448309 RepID=A0A9P6DWF2_9AGAM|nr:hypothetical protein BS47DRAFT_1042664 [Hydnum rufescens UP504]